MWQNSGLFVSTTPAYRWETDEENARGLSTSRYLDS